MCDLLLNCEPCRAQVHGYVSGVNKAGAFVALRGGKTAHVKLSHLADGYVENPAQDFPVGKHVRGHITAKEGSRWRSASLLNCRHAWRSPRSRRHAMLAAVLCDGRLSGSAVCAD